MTAISVDKSLIQTFQRRKAGKMVDREYRQIFEKFGCKVKQRNKTVT
jgi:hypothetical protein